MLTKSEKRRQHANAGFTLPAFSRRYGLTIGKVRRAVKRGEIRTVQFAGLERITPAEAKRVAELFGLKERDDDDG
ncbi:hypothetical protein KIP88_03170 [Bradyrhizobium sp. SRL28]|uniref:hypothetical protein n=1 Tax=Bradyrhizobium sp. SRL28 TaxID=2836178 RepID=UPI001BDECD92|nr:hypothetical protein [Bradyrhizobium sp. SRL28]MBT1509494.1 hypothetical protein [Bradyrhizobium sp. SRL28]